MRRMGKISYLKVDLKTKMAHASHEHSHKTENSQRVMFSGQTS